MDYLASIEDKDIAQKVISGEIRINTKDDFQLPVTQSIPINTKGGGFFHELKVWLLDIQDEVFTEDYYFYMDWLPCEPIIKIPKGFTFNGASVPKYLRNFFSPKGILYAGSIFHDFSYQYWCLLTIDNRIYKEKCKREFCDKLFQSFNENVYKLKFISYVTWLAVRVAGIRGWGDYRRADAQIKDLM